MAEDQPASIIAGVDKQGLNFRPLVPVMAADFIFWCMTSGMSPLMSRFAAAHTEDAVTHRLIATMILAFTAGSIMGRFMVVRFNGEPKWAMAAANLVGALAFLGYLSDHHAGWLLGQWGQGLAMGFYSVGAVNLTASLLPPDQQMRGFALVGVADFLGFSSGPVFAGLLVSGLGFPWAFGFFFVLMVVGCGVSCVAPLRHDRPADGDPKRERKVPAGMYRLFLPLTVALFISLLYHVFYARYLPLMVDTGRLPLETLFFAGYVVGGLAFRFGMVGILERLQDEVVFGLALLSMGIAAVAVAWIPGDASYLIAYVVVAGLLYGLGFELMYVFILSWVATHTRAGFRGKVYSFVFLGFDAAKVVAGLSFGALAAQLTPAGLMRGLLWLLPVYALMVWVLRRHPAPKQVMAETEHPTPTS